MVIVALLLIRSLHWTDFLTHDAQNTVLFLTEKVDQSGAYVAQFEFDDRRVDLYPIPSDTSVEVTGGYGTYRFQAVYPLLVLEGKDLPYIRSTMSLSMGVLLDEVWRADTVTLKLNTTGQFALTMLKSFWHNHQISVTQKLAWLALVADQRTELVVHQPLTILPAPEFVSLFSQSEPLCTVALVNTTPFNGLAGRIADLLEHQNFRVVRTVSDHTSVKKTTVISATQLSADCQQVLNKLTELVPGGVEQQRDEQETVRNRADLVVKLGKDLVQ